MAATANAGHATPDDDPLAVAPPPVPERGMSMPSIEETVPSWLVAARAVQSQMDVLHSVHSSPPPSLVGRPGASAPPPPPPRPASSSSSSSSSLSSSRLVAKGAPPRESAHDVHRAREAVQAVLRRMRGREDTSNATTAAAAATTFQPSSAGTPVVHRAMLRSERRAADERVAAALARERARVSAERPLAHMSSESLILAAQAHEAIGADPARAPELSARLALMRQGSGDLGSSHPPPGARQGASPARTGRGAPPRLQHARTMPMATAKRVIKQTRALAAKRRVQFPKRRPAHAKRLEERLRKGR